MRTVTAQIKKAFDNGNAKKIGNTETDGDNVWLHGNKIIERRSDGVYATLAGWNTPTTRERINGITGAGFHQLKGAACLNGTPLYLNAKPCYLEEWYKVG